MEDFYLALAISVSFFIVKLAIHKMENTKEKDRTAFKDSFYVFLITMVALYVKNEYFTKNSAKTQVFTNEPGF
jgi:archaellum biogenesis protein FlaJ (TadC family)